MPLFVRKINRNKWSQDDNVPVNIPADAITAGCMRTIGNTFSVWEVVDEDAVSGGVLAIASSGDRIESFDAVQLDPEYFSCKEIDSVQNEGATPIEDLVDTHWDLLDLTYKEVGIIAHHIADKIRKGKIERYASGDINKLLLDAIAENRLEASALKPKIREQLGIS